VEEDLMVRQQTQAFLEKKRRELDMQRQAEAAKHFDETVRPVMNHIQDIVVQASSGNAKLDDSALKALAKWRLGH
jgi:uncharacterized membrane-anchored protein YhcB (DUF1043 family)